jgi:[NiFe] hydrogenase assembly HybE family chaperone
MTESLPHRVAVLEAAFRRVQAERMQGVPVLHPGIRVEAIGFEVDAAAGGHTALGVLLTPWFMNLVRLPLPPAAADEGTAIGSTALHTLGGQRLAFLGCFEPQVGTFEACSLYSPVLEFADHAAAAATAHEVLALLRPAPEPSAAPGPALPSRRRFFLGLPTHDRAA